MDTAPRGDELLQDLCRCLSPYVPADEIPPVDAGRGFDWPALVRLARDRWLSAELWRALSDKGRVTPVPPALRERLAGGDGRGRHVVLYLEDQARQVRERGPIQRREALDAVAALNAAGIAPVLLKGVHDLLESPEGEAPPRYMADLDLLVAPDELEAGERALVGLGYARSTGRPRHLYAHHLPPLERDDPPGRVELHWEVAPFDDARLLPIDELRAAPERSGPEGLRYRTLDATQRVAHLVLHAQLADRGYGRHRLPVRPLADLVRILETAGEDAPVDRAVDWDALAERFRRHGASTELGAFLSAGVRLFRLPWPLAEPPRSAWERHTDRCLQLARGPAQLGRAVELIDELRHGFSGPVLRGLYDEASAGPLWRTRLHHAGVLARRYRGRYVRRLSGRGRV